MSERIMKSPRVETILKQAVFDAVKLRETYPGYPSTRLTIENPDIASQLGQGRISLLPEGPWDAGYDHLKPQTKEQLDLIRLQGYDFDDAGRPLHPWLIDMLSDPDVGVVTGTGKYYNMGPNKTADPVIITDEQIPHVLLVLRLDNNLWALPGGFIDEGEDGIEAARREGLEESGLALTGQPERVLYEGIVADARTTTYAWAETFATLWRVSHQLPLTPQLSEVKDACWFPIDQLPDRLHGSHGVLLEEAMRYVLA